MVNMLKDLNVLKKYYILICLLLFSCAINKYNKPDVVAYNWMKASILGDKDSLSKYTDWIESIAPEKRKSQELFQSEKESILEGHSFNSDILRENEWFPQIIPSLKVINTKIIDNTAEVTLSFNKDSSQVITVSLSLKKEQNEWKVYKTK